MTRIREILAGCSLWLWWVFASISGFGFGYIVASKIFSIVNSMFNGPPQISITTFAFPTVGLCLGFYQWLTIRRYLPQAKIWILANTISFSAGAVIWFILDAGTSIFPKFWQDYGDYIWLLTAILASTPFWIILRSHFTKTGGWVLVGSIGLLSIFYSIFSAGYNLGNYSDSDVISGFFRVAFLSGVSSGAVSGLLTVWLLRQFLSVEQYYDTGSTSISEDGIHLGDAMEPKSASRPLFIKSVFVKISTPVLLIGSSLFVLALLGPSMPTYFENTGLEITPQEFADARALWENRPFSHYRFIAEYYTPPVFYCFQNVEIQDEKVVAVYEADGCEGTLSVTDLFNEMERFVGHETTRPLSNDSCSYWYVDAVFDTQLGYPHFMKTHSIYNQNKRKQYIVPNHTFSCLATLPILSTVTIESLTPLP